MFSMLRLVLVASWLHGWCDAFLPSNPKASFLLNEKGRASNPFAGPDGMVFNKIKTRSLSSSQSSSTKLDAAFGGIELSSLVYDSIDMAHDAWDWTANLGAPAALVAGAVLVTLSETREDYAPKKTDKPWIRIAKLMCRFLLASSFALEVISIFVSTVTGSVLLGHGEASKAAAVGYTSSLALLKHHHEFEYLTIQIGFLQGLFHWLASVAIELVIEKDCETTSAKRMNMFLASSLCTLCIWILAFYNHHLCFYSDYWTMLRRYAVLFFQKYLWAKPFRPLSLVYGPSLLVSGILGWRAFNTPPDLDEN